MGYVTREMHKNMDTSPFFTIFTSPPISFDNSQAVDEAGHNHKEGEIITTHNVAERQNVDEGQKRQAGNCLSNAHESRNVFMWGIVYGLREQALSTAPIPHPNPYVLQM